MCHMRISFIMELKIYAWCGNYFLNILHVFYYMFELWIFFYEYSDLDINKKVKIGFI